MAVDANALTSLTDLKTYLGESSSTYDTVLEQCIDRASGIIEAYTGRVFKSRTVTEWQRVYAAGTVMLRKWPVTSVATVGWGSQTVASVVLTAGTNLAGSVSVDETNVVLRVVAASGAATTTTVARATYDAVSEVVGQLNAVSGITAATLVDVPTTDLIPTAGQDVLATTAYLEGIDIKDTNFYADESRGVLTVRYASNGYGDWIESGRPIQIIYTAGYSTVPYAIQDAAIRLAAEIYRRRRYDTGNVVSDFREPVLGLDMQDWLRDNLQQWMEIR